MQSEHNKNFYYQSINLATCFVSLNHRQANSQIILGVHSVDVHIVGSQMLKSYDNKCTNDFLVASIIL